MLSGGLQLLPDREYLCKIRLLPSFCCSTFCNRDFDIGVNGLVCSVDREYAGNPFRERVARSLSTTFRGIRFRLSVSSSSLRA